MYVMECTNKISTCLNVKNLVIVGVVGVPDPPPVVGLFLFTGLLQSRVKR